MQSILVIRHGALGDFVMMIGKMKAIREKHPKAKMTLMTTQAMVKIAEQTGFFDEIVIDNRPRYNLKSWYFICKKILADRFFDEIYDLQNSKRTHGKYYTIARFLTRNPLNWNLFCFDGFIRRSTPAKRKLSWGKQTQKKVEFAFPVTDLSFCHGEGKNFHLLPQKYALLIPGCSVGHNFKRWPASFFREVTLWLGNKGIKSVVLGTKAEEEAIQTIVRDNPYAVDFMNKSGLLDIPDLARKSMFVIGNDTGPTHMSTFTKTPVVTLFCERTSQAAPKLPNVVNLIAPNIEDISVQQVTETLAKILKKS